MSAGHQLDRKRAASLAAVQALLFANLPICSLEQAGSEMAGRFIEHEHVFEDAAHLLVDALRDEDPVSMDAFHIHQALSLLADVEREPRS
jgi:hypothetical protein